MQISQKFTKISWTLPFPLHKIKLYCQFFLNVFSQQHELFYEPLWLAISDHDDDDDGDEEKVKTSKMSQKVQIHLNFMRIPLWIKWKEIK